MSNSIGQLLLAEFTEESKATRALLALVPIDKSDWKPHDKSMSMGSLARHVAEIPGWFKETLLDNELDFSKGDFKPFVPANTQELLDFYDKRVKVATDILSNVQDATFSESWCMRNGEQIYFTLPKSNVVRTWCLNHWYHHRAQLGVYLRLNNIPLPSIYGPTADMS